ncbi:hypothetical protein [Duganella callida]|uniref:DUF2875 domain-containing protein n=1 Tax=Duganella callida TaxID=2561932 RepID=A0A4Y9RZH4_9BURK|nr:hypothetical protein [Duganella callida]TFW13631.1 hypothetical protein E4L98_28710 [Duganella callida]
MNVLRNLVLLLATFGASWGGAIWYWRETNRMPATSELVLYMLVLPLALLTGWWGGRKAWDRMTSLASERTRDQVSAAQVTATATPVAMPLPPALTIAASALRVPHGDSAHALRGALAGAGARPTLDSELYDDDGYPVMSARLADSDAAGLREELQQWRPIAQLDDPHFDSAQWRALAAASAVLAELAAQAFGHAYLAPWLQQEQDRQQSRLPPGAPVTPAPPMLQLLALWPSDWKAQQAAVADQWLREVLTRAGWPAQRLAAPAAATRGDGDDAGAALARLLAQRADVGQDFLAIVIAAGSHLSEEGIAQLAERNALFTSGHPQGQIPGEGAAGLLLADAAQAKLIAAAGQPGSVLQTVASGRRAVSADEVRRDTDTCLSTVAAKALQDGQVDGAHIALVTADTSHRTSRVTELMHVVTSVAPQLDPGTDVIGIAGSCGSCGAVSWLTALAVADAEAQDRGGPVLCISNEDPYRRYAALLRPATAA